MEAARLADEVDPGISASEKDARIRRIQKLRYGPQFKFDEFLVMPTVVHAVAYGLGFALVAMIIASFSPVGGSCKQLIVGLIGNFRCAGC